MRKEVMRKKRSESLIIIANLMISIFAIAFMIGVQAEVVRGQTVSPVPAAVEVVENGIGLKVGDVVTFNKGTNILVGDKKYEVKSAQLIKDSYGNYGYKANFNGADIQVTEELKNNGLIDKETLKPNSKFVEEGTTSASKGGLLNSLTARPDKVTGEGAIATFVKENPGWGGVLQGAVWATVAYIVVPYIGEILGLEPETTKALQYGVSSGLFAAGAIRGIAAEVTQGGGTGFLSQTGIIGANPFISGIVVGVVVFVLTYEKVKYETVNFQCLPWEAPIGGDDCEKCNDGVQPCSEYRCKSLGQACGIVNAGTDKEMCVWLNEKDVDSPAIRPWEYVLTQGLEYTNTKDRPPSWGTEIQRETGLDGCIPAFTPITFGIQTDKPAQCKIDYIRGSANSSSRNVDYLYEDMKYYFGENSYYDYNHSQTMNLPGPSAINSYAESQTTEETGGLTVKNDGRFELYVRCRSANGYFNPDPYVIKFCVDKGPDTTPPLIEETSIRNNQPVQFEVDKVPLIVYTNEPASCRWSKTDQKLDKMENEMSCAKSPSEMGQNLLYACSGTLEGIEDKKDNVFYIRCEDGPWKEKADRNEMSQSYVLTLKGTQPLMIDPDSLYPSKGENITGATSSVAVNFVLQTEEGYNKGEAECYYSQGNENNYVPFFETNSYMHKQRQDLREGIYTYFIKCIDLGGNQARINTSFNVYVDTYAPIVTRVYYDANNLKLITDEDSSCYYTNNEALKCNYNIDDEGVMQFRHETSDEEKDHYALWDKEMTYYVKCRDINGKEPLPNQCSITVKPVEIISKDQVEDEED